MDTEVEEGTDPTSYLKRISANPITSNSKDLACRVKPEFIKSNKAGPNKDIKDISKEVMAEVETPHRVCGKSLIQTMACI